MHWTSLFGLVVYSGMCVIYLRIFYWRKLFFPFTSVISFLIGAILWCPHTLFLAGISFLSMRRDFFSFMYSLLEFVWVHNLCKYNHPIVSGRHCFLVVIFDLWLLQSILISAKSHKPWKDRFNGHFLFRIEFSKASHSLYSVHLWVYILVIVFYKKKLVWYWFKGIRVYFPSG